MVVALEGTTREMAVDSTVMPDVRVIRMTPLVNQRSMCVRDHDGKGQSWLVPNCLWRRHVIRRPIDLGMRGRRHQRMDVRNG